MAVVALLCGVLAWLLPGGQPIPRLPAGLPLSVTAAATALILLASKIRSGLLRRALLRSAPGEAAAGALLAAYRKATLTAFALLDCAALLGLSLAVVTGSVRYGVVLCAASFVALLVRWPRGGELARLARRLPGERRDQLS
jgi:hypothetical protein